jgi:type II secretory pathway component PulF
MRNLLYFILMTVFALGLLFGFAFFINHKAKEWEEEYDPLPVMHSFLSSIARFITSYWWIIVIAAGGACGFTLWRRQKTVNSDQ